MGKPTHELIPLTSPERWSEELARFPHGFCHTWEYCQAMFLTTGYPTYLYRFQDGERIVICVFCERSFRGTTDIVSPYGFNGFIANDDYPEFNQHWELFMKDRGYVCGYIGLDPSTHVNLGFPKSDLYIHNEVYLLDIGRQAQEVLEDMSENRRRQIRQANLEWDCYTLDKEALSTFFLDHFSEFMKGKKVSSVYHFRRETLTSLIENQRSLLVGYIRRQQVLAVSLFGYSNSGADFLFNVSIEEGKRYSVGLIWRAILKLQSLHIPLLNLGGGVHVGDALSEFKERFGATKADFVSLRQVYNVDVYNSLCKEVIKDRIDKRDFFPPYRRGS